MKKIKLLSAIAAIFFAVSFLSCSKGEQGVTGPQGPAGTNGTSGVVASTFTVTSSDWSTTEVQFTPEGLTAWYYDVPYASMGNVYNAIIGDNGAGGFEIFYSTDNINFSGLPALDIFYNGDYLTYNFYSTGVLQIFFDYTNAPTPSQILYFKVVAIPPSLYVKYPNTDWSSYSQVKAIMNAENIQTK